MLKYWKWLDEGDGGADAATEGDTQDTSDQSADSSDTSGDDNTSTASSDKSTVDLSEVKSQLNNISAALRRGGQVDGETLTKVSEAIERLEASGKPQTLELQKQIQDLQAGRKQDQFKLLIGEVKSETGLTDDEIAILQPSPDEEPAKLKDRASKLRGRLDLANRNRAAGKYPDGLNDIGKSLLDSSR